MFLDSDTDMMVLSFVPSRRDAEPLTIQAADAVRRIVDRMEGSHRLMIHGRVNPNQPGDLEAMDDLKDRWKSQRVEDLYAVGTGRQGILSVGRRRHTLYRESARSSASKYLRAQGAALRQAVLRAQSVQRHRRRGQALSRRELPDLSLGLRHRRRPSAPFSGRGASDGIDTLIRSLVENGVKPNSNVYAELGSDLALPHARSRRARRTRSAS